jgi:hypothetical protein
MDYFRHRVKVGTSRVVVFITTRLPEKSYKRECQETYLPVGSVPTLFCFGIQPNRLNVHS